MKIEIAESLVYSYLKHVEGCRIVQTNWVTRSKWAVSEYEELRARNLYEKIATCGYFDGIFKNSSFDQLIKQAEIDVLGLNAPEGCIYGVDVAFHTGGLNYGDKNETALRIVKKIFRTVFIMQSYFNENERFHSIFITPNVNQSTLVIIEDLIAKAKEVIDDDNILIDFISNEQFYSNIVDTLLEGISDENDSTELFSRAYKLMRLDKRNPTLSEPRRSDQNTIVTSTKKEVNGMKIGQFVQNSFRKAYELNLLSEQEINDLQKPGYSKRVFNSNFEVLRNVNRTVEDELGRKRYYAREVFCGNYHLTSQWIEPQWGLVLDWLRKIGYDYDQYN